MRDKFKITRAKVGDKGKNMRQSIQWETGRRQADKWETKVKSYGQSIQSRQRRQVGDKGKIMRAEHPESSGSGRQAETSGRQR